MTITTSRSRIVSYLNCARLGYLGYDWDGTGLEPVSAALPLVNGIAIHDGLAQLLTNAPPDEVISKVCADYEAELRARGVANEDPDGLAWLLAEQQTLIAGTLHAWLRVRLPALKADYDFLAVEKELLWPLDPGGQILDTVRCDVLARRKSDGGLFYVEWKTTASGGDEWAKQWEHNTQLLANTLAVEEMLHERVEGVLIEGLIKGRRAVDRSRYSPYYERRIQQSPLCYGYRHDTGVLQAGYTAAKGWRKVATWLECPIATWVADVMTVEECQALFAPCPPIRPRREHLDRWRRQTIAAERQRAHHLEIVKADPAALETFFPMNDEHCFRYWGHPCPMEPLCFGSEIAADPLGSGLYQRRVPHHPAPVEEA